MIRFLFYTFSFINLVLNTSLFSAISKLEQLAQREQDMLAALGTYIHDADRDNISVPESIQTYVNIVPFYVYSLLLASNYTSNV